MAAIAEPIVSGEKVLSVCQDSSIGSEKRSPEPVQEYEGQKEKPWSVK